MWASIGRALIGAAVAFNEHTSSPPAIPSTETKTTFDLEMVLIPADSFMMGDDTFRPIHKVTITKPFYLYRDIS